MIEVLKRTKRDDAEEQRRKREKLQHRRETLALR
jgi:hypothetical protein